MAEPPSNRPTEPAAPGAEHAPPAPSRRRRRPLRWLARIVTALVVLLVLLLGGGFALLQTDFARTRLAGLVEGALAGPGQSARVAGISGTLPFDIRLGAFELADAQGTWLAVRDARLAWRPWQLFRGRLVVEAAGAETVRLERLPAGEAPSPPPADEPFALPELPRLPERLPLPIAVELQRLYAERIELGPGVIGEAASFTLDGRAAADGDGAQASLDLRRIDQATADAELRADLDLVSRRLALHLTATETGGLLRAAVGDPRVGDLRLALKGEGPLDGWRGRLDLAAAGLVDANADLALGLEGLPSVGINGRLRPAPALVPPAFAPLLGPEVALRLAVEPDGPDRLHLRQLGVDAAALRLSGDGHVDLGGETLAVKLVLAIADLAPFSELAGTPLRGDATLRLAADGPLLAPRLAADLAASDLGAAELSVARAALELQATPLGALTGNLPEVEVTGVGRLDGLAVNGAALPAIDPVDLSLAARIPPQGRIELAELLLRGPELRLLARGHAERDSLAGEAHLELAAPQLAPLAAALRPLVPAIPELAGAVTLTADAAFGPDLTPLDATLALRGQELAGLPPGAGELLGPAPTLDARLQVTDRTEIELQELALRGAAVSLDGQGRYGLASEALGGTLRLELPRLAALDPLVQQGLSGSATLTAEASGSLAEPAARIDLAARDVAVAQQSFPEARLTATVGGTMERLAGDLALMVQEARGRLTLDSRYRFLDQRRLEVEGLRLAGPGTELTGELATDLETLRSVGRLQGRVSDLAALRPFTGQDLRGAVSLDTVLQSSEGRQDARMLVTAEGVKGPFGRLARLNLRGSGQDLLGRPSVDVALDADDFVQGDIQLATARATARGTLEALRLELAASGRQGDRPAELRLDAQAALASDPRWVTVSSLDGAFAGKPIRLNQQLTASFGEAGYEVAGLDLSFGAARLVGQAAYGANRLAGNLELRQTPLGEFADLGLPELAGAVAARVQLAGRPAAPQVRVEVDGSGIAPAQTGGMQVPPADLTLRADLADGGLDADLRLAGLTAQPLMAQARVPLVLSLEPFAFDLPQDRPLSATVRGQADLARLGQILALDGQEIAGRLDIDLRVAGTLARPAASGEIAIAEGRVEDAITGVILRDLELRIVGDQNRLVVQRLNARDTGDGRISGQGQIRLDGATPSSFDVAIEIRSFRALRNQFGTALVSGDLTFAGDLAAARLAGTVSVDRADLEIPSVAGGGPPTLDVRVAGEPVPDAAAAGDAAPMRIALDLAVEARRVFVRGRGLQSEWGGDLTVRGTADSPVVLGRIEVRRGFMDILDRRFALDRGIIDFDGRQPPLPTVNISTSSSGFELRAIVTVTGPVDDLKIALTSEPSFPQDEIVSRLLFNRPASQITPAQGLRVAAAVQQLQGGGEGLLGNVRQALGVDTLDVGGTGPDDANVSVGRYINDRVFLELQQGLTPETSRAKVNIELLPNLSASTEINQAAQPGVRLQWSYDY